MKVFGKKLYNRARILTPPLPWHRPTVIGGSEQTVVLLHGLWRSKDAMSPMAEYLNEAHQMKTISIPYDSVRSSYEEMVESVAQQMDQLGVSGEVSFVTHSLGGLVLRGLLARKSNNWSFGKAVMLAPPNRGSQIVDWLSGSPVRVLLGNASKFLTPPLIGSQVPELEQPEAVAVIMGRRNSIRLFTFLLDSENDGIVSVDDGKLEGLSQFSVEDVDHTFITMNDKVHFETARFLNA